MLEAEQSTNTIWTFQHQKRVWTLMVQRNINCKIHVKLTVDEYENLNEKIFGVNLFTANLCPYTKFLHPLAHKAWYPGKNFVSSNQIKA